MSKNFRVPNSKRGMYYCGSSLAECVGLTCTSLKESFRRFGRELFPVIKSWER